MSHLVKLVTSHSVPGNKDIGKLFILLAQLFQLNLSNKVYSLNTNDINFLKIYL